MKWFESVPIAWEYAGGGPVIVHEAAGSRVRLTTEALIRYYDALRFLRDYEGPEEKAAEAMIIDRIEKRESRRLTESFSANPELVKAFKRGRVTFKAVLR